ncbi:MAG: hypothetical protein AAB225_14780 [Acidobacteriota bacterium]
MLTKTSSGSELLLRGAKSYLDALAAIAAFKGEVQKACSAVYDQHRAELTAQLGLEDAEWKPHESDSVEERWAEVGVLRTAGTGGTFYLYLWWGETEDSEASITARVCLALYGKRLRDEIYEEFRGRNRRCRIETSRTDTFELNLETPIKPEEIGSAAEVLDTLMREWLGYCKSVGGLKLKKRQTG